MKLCLLISSLFLTGMGGHAADPETIGHCNSIQDAAEAVNSDAAQSARANAQPAQPTGTASTQAGPASLKNSTGMEFKWIAPGKFMMGSNLETPGGKVTAPVHEVTLTEPFYMGVYEVTQEQFEQVMGRQPTSAGGPVNPASAVSWSEAVTFCEKLSAMPAERSAGRVYRLPTEAEWEYACRAGTTTEYCFGDDASELGEYAWFLGNSGNSEIDFQKLGPLERVEAVQSNDNRLHPIGQKKPNAWGLHDMHGNMWEWCQDYYSKYTAEAVTNPLVSEPGSGVLGSTRIVRSGGWRVYALGCSSAYRNGNMESLQGPVNGFRVVLNASAGNESTD